MPSFPLIDNRVSTFIHRTLMTKKLANCLLSDVAWEKIINHLEPELLRKFEQLDYKMVSSNDVSKAFEKILFEKLNIKELPIKTIEISNSILYNKDELKSTTEGLKDDFVEFLFDGNILALGVVKLMECISYLGYEIDPTRPFETTKDAKTKIVVRKKTNVNAEKTKVDYPQ